MLIHIFGDGRNIFPSMMYVERIDKFEKKNSSHLNELVDEPVEMIDRLFYLHPIKISGSAW